MKERSEPIVDQKHQTVQQEAHSGHHGIAEKGAEGEILKVVRDAQPMQYHVRFPGRTLQVPESLLEPADPANFREPEDY